MKRLALLAFIGLFCTLPALPQDASACDAAGLQTAIESQLESMNDDPAAALSEILQLAAVGLRDCSGDAYAYDSVNEGLHPVLGPLSLAQGLHLFTLTTEKTGIVEAVTLSEECGTDLERSILNIAAGQGAQGAERLVRVESDCDLYLQLRNLRAAWTLEIAKLS